jgi:tetratricopeptide (TPR) repeat protein
MNGRKILIVLIFVAALYPVWHFIRVKVSDRAVADAQQAIRSSDADAAVDFMFKAVNWDPANAQKRSLLGNALLLVNQPYDAAFELKKAMANFSDPDIAFNLGVAFVRIGDSQTAERFFDEAERRHRRELRRRPESGKAMFRLGRFFLALGKRREALDCFIKATMLDPDNPAHVQAVERLRGTL